MVVFIKCNLTVSLSLFQYQGASDKEKKQFENAISEANSRIEDANRTISDLGGQRNKMQAENADLTRQLEEAEHRVSQLSKERSSLASQLEEARSSLEDETRVGYRILQELIVITSSE